LSIQKPYFGSEPYDKKWRVILLKCFIPIFIVGVNNVH
jgi:hypothetical protein